MSVAFFAKIKELRDESILSDFEVHFVKLLVTLHDQVDDGVLLAATLVNFLTRQGHVCVDLKNYADAPFPPPPESENSFRCPPLLTWQETLRQCPLVGAPGEFKPLILENNRLYLYRYWEYEQQLAAFIRDSLKKPQPVVDKTILRETVAQLFPKQSGNEGINGQEIAALTAIHSNFCLISGGPGTGKTFTIAKILFLLLAQDPTLRIALAAPTGKAAMRLKQAIAHTINTFPYPLPPNASIPNETYTLHRLLGSLPHSPYFRHNAANLLPYDIVIVDEASMVDLALLAKLVQALSPTARWILVGDKDQLASIEVGTILADICEIKNSSPQVEPVINNLPFTRDPRGQNIISQPRHLRDCIMFLEKNYRFNTHSDIAQLAFLVKTGQSEAALRLLKTNTSATLKWRSFSSVEDMQAALSDKALAHFSVGFEAQEPQTVLHALEKFRILSVLRYGAFGMLALNRIIEQMLVKNQLIKEGIQRWYPGRPILITQNNYFLELFNGDSGVVLHDPTNQQELRAFFSMSAGRLRTFLPSQLPEHETVYAMTIHKSQGSEFDEVLILLPPQISPLLSRELIYTGITRARQRVEIWGDEPIFKQALAQKIYRMSGVCEALLR